jgi:hypothetical protein
MTSMDITPMKARSAPVAAAASNPSVAFAEPEEKKDDTTAPQKQPKKMESITLGSLSTSYTPHKNAAKKYTTLEDMAFAGHLSSKLANGVVERRQNCTGCSIFRVNEDGKSDRGKGTKGTCLVCKKVTGWYCLECHHWFCNVVREDEDNAAVLKIAHPMSDKVFYARNTCFMVGHKQSMAKDATASIEQFVSKLAISDSTSGIV